MQTWVGKKARQKKHKDVKWDDEIPTENYFIELKRVSKNQIVWGGNYFPVLWNSPCKHFIFWDKLVASDMSFSDGELAWTSFNMAIKKWSLRNITGDKIHPTQKPVKLYEWLLMNYAKEGDKILDTHLGSGSIAIACHNLGFSLDAWEIDKDYHEAAVKRFNNHAAQLRIY